MRFLMTDKNSVKAVGQMTASCTLKTSYRKLSLMRRQAPNRNRNKRRRLPGGRPQKDFWKRWKKLLTKDDRGAIINKLSLRDTAEDSKRTLITEQWKTLKDFEKSNDLWNESLSNDVFVWQKCCIIQERFYKRSNLKTVNQDIVSD